MGDTCDEVAAALRAAIEDHGPISFAEFMEIALYGPGGFYQRPPVGERGHFVTSPHVHPVFGLLLARALRQLRDALGRPEPFRLVEVGAGDGTLAAQLLEALAEVRLEFTAVERSAGAREALARLPARVAADLDEVGPGLAGVVLANELLDNLPFHRVRRTQAGLVELRVARRDGGFIEVEAPCPPDVAAAAPDLRPGQEAAVSLEAMRLVDRLAALLNRGYALLIDFGEATGRPAGPVHGYRGHRVVAEVLVEPGSADITAGVDFAAVARRAAERGLTTAFGPVSQRGALLALGFREWSQGERERQTELLASGGGMDAVRTWSARSRASLLVDPAGLGAVRWLLLSTPTLPVPGWLTEAARRDLEEGSA